MNLITKSSLALTVGIAVLASLSSLAQNPGRFNRFLPAGGPQATPPAGANATTDDTPPRPPRPVPPLIAALDANSDGVIDAAEIANAVAALQSLDTNGDGELTADEIHPARPEGAPAGGPGHRPHGRGPRGEAPVGE